MIAALCLVGRSAASTYELPALPAFPAIPAALPENSVPLGDPDSFPEAKMSFPIAEGPFQPTWSSIAANFPVDAERLRCAKFGIWVHFGPQSSGASGDWYARHLYQPGSPAYANHLANFGHPSAVGYKDFLHQWNPTGLRPADLARTFHDAGARFLLVQGVHHDNFDNWNSRYNPWNTVNLGPRRDTMAEWFAAARDLDMSIGVAFHHEYSWWFFQTAFRSDTSGPLAGQAYDARTSRDGTGTWWEHLDPRLLYNIDLSEYRGVSTPVTGYWNPDKGVFTRHLDYADWYANWWALRILDVIERYDPDFIYTDGTSSQPFSGRGTGTGYKCDAMQRVIAHLSNRALQRHGKVDTHAVVKFHSGDRLTTTYENTYPAGIKRDQPWIGEVPVGDWFYAPGFVYDSGMVVRYLLECVSRDGAAAICIAQKPDGGLDAGSRAMLARVGAWLKLNGAGVYGGRAWVRHAEGARSLPHGKLGPAQAGYAFTESDFRFTVGSDGALYVYCMTVPAPGARLRVTSLGASSGLLLGPIEQVSLLGHAGPLEWSQEEDALAITCPANMPFQTAVCFRVGPAAAVGLAAPTNLDARSGSASVNLTWTHSSPSATFDIDRATSPAGPFIPLATGLSQRSHRDTNAAPGTLYYYSVVAREHGLSSRRSAPTPGIATGPSSGPSWQSRDIGDVAVPGSIRQVGDTVLLEGSGEDIWGAGDEFRFAYGTLEGDGQLTARILGMTNTHEWAKAGLMVRQSLAPDSAYVIHYLSPANGVALQTRAAAGASAGGVAEHPAIAAPCRLRLQRAGDTFSAYYSVDSTNWRLLGSVKVPMTGTVYAGLAVSAHNDGAVCQVLANEFSVGSLPAPDAPGPVAAYGGEGGAVLSWPPAFGANSYLVQRASAPSGPWTTIASGLAAPLVVQNGLTNGLTYHYRVAAANALGQGPWSAPVPVSPAPSSLPAGWNQSDIGAVGLPGSGGEKSGVFHLQASGSDIWDSADSFRFAAMPIVGDFAITARVLSLENTAAFAKAGIMIRQSLAPDSPGAINFLSPVGGVGFQGRAAPAEAQGIFASDPGIIGPVWLRLTRHGDRLAAYHSRDGQEWTCYGATTLPFSGSLHAGLAVCSVNNRTLCHALFDQVKIAAIPVVPVGLRSAPSSGQINLSWLPVRDADRYRVRRSTSPDGPFVTLTTTADSPRYTDLATAPGQTYYYKIAAANAAGTSADTPPAAATALPDTQNAWKLARLETGARDGDERAAAIR